MMRFRTTCGLVAATLLTLAMAASAEASNAKKDPSAQHAQRPVAAIAGSQTQFAAVTMAYQAEGLYLVQITNVASAQFEGVARLEVTNDALQIGRRGEDPPEATASTNLTLNTQTAANRSFSANFAGTYNAYMDIGSELPRTLAAANNTSNNGTVLRL